MGHAKFKIEFTGVGKDLVTTEAEAYEANRDFVEFIDIEGELVASCAAKAVLYVERQDG